MPWREASPMDQRTQFIADHLRDVLSITELCALYGISRRRGTNGSTATSATADRPGGGLAAPAALAESDIRGVVSAILDARAGTRAGRQEAPGAAA